MKLSNWPDEETMSVEALCVEMQNDNSDLTVVFPSGHLMRVFDDKIYMSDPGTPRTKNGGLLWKANDRMIAVSDSD